MKVKGVIKGLIFQKKVKNLQNYNSKIYLGIFLELLSSQWHQFSFRQFLVPAYTSQGLQAPSNVFSANYRVLICCNCLFQSCSLCLFWLLLFVRLQWTMQRHGREKLPLAQGQGQWPRGATPRPRSEAVAERSNPTSKEWWL